MRRTITLLIGLLFISGHAFTQQMLKVGEVKDGKIQITNKQDLNNYFMNCLGHSGILGKELKSESSPEGDRFYVTTTVTGNKDQVTAVGVLLVNKNNELMIVEATRDDGEGDGPGTGIGGSMNVQCVGAPCGLCFPDLEWIAGQWYPLVRCQCFDPEGICNSIVSFTVNLNVGF